MTLLPLVLKISANICAWIYLCFWEKKMWQTPTAFREYSSKKKMGGWMEMLINATVLVAYIDILVVVISPYSSGQYLNCNCHWIIAQRLINAIWNNFDETLWEKWTIIDPHYWAISLKALNLERGIRMHLLCLPASLKEPAQSQPDLGTIDKVSLLLYLTSYLLVQNSETHRTIQWH